MPNTLITLDPRTSPVSLSEQDKQLGEQSILGGVVPDGTGLQIIFDIEGESYVLAGPRAKQILTVLGGAIEAKYKSVSFLAQLQEEVHEETFGVLALEVNDNQYQLRVNNNAVFALEMCPQQTAMVYKPGKFAYVTFTARCKEMDFATLLALSEQLTPTAQFWEKLGAFLVGLQFNKNTPRDDSFKAFWQTQQTQLNAILADLSMRAQELGTNLLVTPEQAFEVATINEAWDKVRNIESFADLTKLSKSTVGRYSERDGYYIFKASELLLASEKKIPVVKDIFGTVVAPAHPEKTVKNEAEICMTYPHLGIAPIQKAASLQSSAELSAQKGVFGASTTSTVVPVAQPADTTVPAPF